MSKKELVHKQLNDLYEEGAKLFDGFKKDEIGNFRFDYQRWYTKALSSVVALAPDRLAEFRGYYEIDPKRKSLEYGTYVIQDYLKGITPNQALYPQFDIHNEAVMGFYNQLTIIFSLVGRIDSVLANIEGELYAELQDSEIVIARQLIKVSPRAAGALMGVVLEGHLQKVAKDHSVKIGKKHPTIADLNEPLKAAGIIDTATWRKISYLADLRNNCSHKKDVEPTKEQVEELIEGAEWLTKNVF